MLRDILQLPPPALRDFDGQTPLDLVDVIVGSTRTSVAGKSRESDDGFSGSECYVIRCDVSACLNPEEGHGNGAALPVGAQKPGSTSVHASLLAAPEALLYVPPE